MPSKNYKRKYECPYCDKKMPRENLIVHVNDDHSDMIPEGYTARRVVFNKINNLTHGTCRMCKGNTEWNEAAGRYNVLCDDKECHDKFREQTRKNYIKVLGTDNPTDSIEHQEKMLAGRKISGTYKFKNGQTVTYTGSYEAKLLEFEEKVLGFRADDIMMPGPVIEYNYGGTKHKYITDQLLIPYNLIIEVKDGGKNPNRRPMKDYREKQVAKELSIVQLGEYNYLRLVDNDFGQLLGIMAEMKRNAMYDPEGSKKIVHIYEGSGPVMGAIPNPYVDPTYVINYGMKNVFSGDDNIEGEILTKDMIKGLIPNEDGTLKEVNVFKYLKDKSFSIYKYLGEASIIDKVDSLSPYCIYEALSGHKVTDYNQIDWDDLFEKVEFICNLTIDPDAFKEICESSMMDSKYTMDVLDPLLVDIKESIVESYSNVDIKEDPNGYFATRKDTLLRSASYKTMGAIPTKILSLLNGR